MNGHSSIPSTLSAPISGWRGVLSWLVFPALLAAVIAGSVALLGRRLPLPAVSGAVLLGAIAVILGLERLVPLHRAWNARPEGLDLVLIVVNRVVDVAVVAGAGALVGWLQGAGLGLALLHAWPTRAPLVLQAALGAVLAEAIRYALHRLSHRPNLLGRVHRTHHQPRRMYALNGPRLHPGNQLWIAAANALPMLLLGAQLPAVILLANITVFFVLFQHANVRLRFDGWNRLLATPDVHRLHHARDTRRPVNFGIVLLVFDRLWGTYRRTADAPGVDGIGPDDDAELALPQRAAD
jgi:sterol desaturase/sphingolipid hydroxylase (fatty acid hydroxylase superfamily)